MKERILSAGMLIVVLGAVVLLSIQFKIAIDVFVALIGAASVFEFCKAIKALSIYQISIPSILFAIAYPMLLPFNLSSMLCYAYTILMLCMIVFFHEKISFKDFAYTYSMTILITLCLSAISLIKDLDPEHRIMYFTMSIAIPWLADVGAYFTGFFLGKHKLCPKISPKKTVEGAVGGILFCIFSSVVISYLFNIVIYGNTLNINYVNAFIIGAGGSLLSILGDLSFSVIKRAYSVKDYGDLIPGHGGILDRFDSVICYAPYMYFILLYLPIVMI